MCYFLFNVLQQTEIIFHYLHGSTRYNSFHYLNCHGRIVAIQQDASADVRERRRHRHLMKVPQGFALYKRLGELKKFNIF